MRYAMVLPLLFLLAITTSGCGKHIVYLKGVPGKYTADTPASKPGRGEKIYLADSSDNRCDAEHMYGQVLFIPDRGDATASAVTESVKDCLSTYGYVVQSIKNPDAAIADQEQPAKVLYTSIDTLYTRRESGWVITDVGTSELSFSIKERGSPRPLWSKQVSKKAEVVSVMAAYLGDAEKAVNDSFIESMKEFESAISSPDFKNALTQAPEASTE